MNAENSHGFVSRWSAWILGGAFFCEIVWTMLCWLVLPTLFGAPGAIATPAGLAFALLWLAGQVLILPATALGMFSLAIDYFAYREETQRP